MSTAAAKALAAGALALCLSCTGENAVRSTRGAVQVQARALQLPGVSSVTISAERAKATFALTYGEASDSFWGVLNLPAGSDVLTARAYSSDGREVASASAPVLVEAGRSALVYLTLRGAPVPEPDHGPVVTSVTVNHLTAWVGQEVAASASAVDPDGTAIEWHWASDCSPDRFTAPGGQATSWSSTTVGRCTLTVTATSNGLSDSASVVVYVMAGEGAVEVEVDYVPGPLIDSVSLFGDPPCDVHRSSADASCATRVSPGASLAGSVALGPTVSAPSTVALRDSCGGIFSGGLLLAGDQRDEYRFTWTAPGLDATVCMLTAQVTSGHGWEEFSIAIRVASPPADEALDLAALRIAPYRWGRKAAASYTFDDGPASSFALASAFGERGLRASFFIIPAFVKDSEWASWRALSDSGHEVGNHSMNHLDLSDPALSDDTLAREITGAQQLLADRLGVRPVSFAFPFHKSSARSAAVALGTHALTRSAGPFSGPGYRVVALNDASTIGSVNDQLQASIDAGAWFVAAGHGIDGDGWRPISSAFLAQHLDFAAAHGDDLWVDTFAAVGLYRVARERLHPVLLAKSARAFAVRLEGSSGEALAAVPLTIEIPIRSRPSSATAQTPDGASVPAAIRGDTLYLEARPGEIVQVTLTF